MDEILDQIFYGRLSPFEKPTIMSPIHRKTFRELCNKEKSLTDKLGNEEQEQFKEYVAKCNEVQMFEELNAFKMGFRLGSKLIIQTLFSGDEK